MKKVFKFVSEKYQNELLRWLTYLAIPTSILFIAGYIIGDDVGRVLMALGFIIPFTASITAQMSLNYGGKHILSMAALGGLSFGIIIMYLVVNMLGVSVIDEKYFLLLAIILMAIFSIASSRRKFSQQDKLILAGMSMMLTFTAGAVLGVILAILFSFISGKGFIIGFGSGIVIMVVYLGSKLGEHFNLDENEIYSPKGAGIIGAGIGAGIGLIFNWMFSFYYPTFYYVIGTIKLPLNSVINIIAGLTTGLFFGYFTQKMKKEVDKKG